MLALHQRAPPNTISKNNSERNLRPQFVSPLLSSKSPLDAAKFTQLIYLRHPNKNAQPKDLLLRKNHPKANKPKNGQALALKSLEQRKVLMREAIHLLNKNHQSRSSGNFLLKQERSPFEHNPEFKFRFHNQQEGPLSRSRCAKIRNDLINNFQLAGSFGQRNSLSAGRAHSQRERPNEAARGKRHQYRLDMFRTSQEIGAVGGKISARKPNRARTHSSISLV